MRVGARCEGDTLLIDMHLNDGRTVTDHDRVRVVANNFLALGGDGILTPIMPEGGYAFDDSLPLVRDTLVDWLRGRGDIEGESFSTAESQKWWAPSELPAGCALP